MVVRLIWMQSSWPRLLQIPEVVFEVKLWYWGERVQTPMSCACILFGVVALSFGLWKRLENPFIPRLHLAARSTCAPIVRHFPFPLKFRSIANQRYFFIFSAGKFNFQTQLWRDGRVYMVYKEVRFVNCVQNNFPVLNWVRFSRAPFSFLHIFCQRF